MDIPPVAYFVVGGAAGYLLRWALAETRKPARPMRLTRARRYDVVVPSIAAPPPIGHETQCRTWCYRFITFAETVGCEQGKPAGRLPSYRELAAAAGTTWRPFEWYLDVLREGGVVDVRGRGGVWWAMGKAGRRAALASLPYPDSRPPRFPFAGPA